MTGQLEATEEKVEGRGKGMEVWEMGRKERKDDYKGG